MNAITSGQKDKNGRYKKLLKEKEMRRQKMKGTINIQSLHI